MQTHAEKLSTLIIKILNLKRIYYSIYKSK